MDAHQFTGASHTIDFEKCNTCGACVEACNFSALRIAGAQMAIDDVMKEIVSDLDFYENSGGGVTLSGGEPLLNHQFALGLLQRCRQMKIHTCVETSGFVDSPVFERLLGEIDVLLIDYKMTDPLAHKKYTGVPNEPILANLDLAYRAGARIIVRCPIIPGINDTAGHFAGIRDLEKKYPLLDGLEIMPYHNFGVSKCASIGARNPLPEIRTATPQDTEQWLARLKALGCARIRIN